MSCRQLLGQPDIVEEQTHRPVLLVDKCLDVAAPNLVSPIALVGDWESVPGLVLANTFTASNRVVVPATLLTLRWPSESNADQRSVVGIGNVARSEERRVG